MLVLRNETAILGDFIESDIADHIRWETDETEWKLWDAPWEHEGKSDKERAVELEGDIERMRGWVARNKALADDVRRTKFEVCLADSDNPLRAIHVGSCATYQQPKGPGGFWLGSEQARPDATVPMRTPYGYAELLAMSQARARAASKIAVAHDLAFLDRNE